MYRQTQTRKKERRKRSEEKRGEEKRREEKEINWLDCVCNHSCFSPLATGCGVERNFLPHFFRQLRSDHPYNHAHPNCVSLSCPSRRNHNNQSGVEKKRRRNQFERVALLCQGKRSIGECLCVCGRTSMCLRSLFKERFSQGHGHKLIITQAIRFFFRTVRREMNVISSKENGKVPDLSLLVEQRWCLSRPMSKCCVFLLPGN